MWCVYYISDKFGTVKSRPIKKDEALDYLEIFNDAVYIKKVSGWFGVGKTIWKKEKRQKNELLGT